MSCYLNGDSYKDFNMKNKLTKKEIKQITKDIHADKDLQAFLMGVAFEIIKTDNANSALKKMLSVYTMGVLQGMDYTLEESNEALKEGD